MTASAPSWRSSARPTSSPRASVSASSHSRSSTRPWPPRPRTRRTCCRARSRTARPSRARRRSQRDDRREDRDQARCAHRGPHVVAYLHKTSPDLPAQIGVPSVRGWRRRDRSRCRDAHRGLRPVGADPRRDRPRDGRARAQGCRGDRQGGGQARGRPPQDHRGSGQRLLQEAVLLEQAFARTPRSPSRRSSTRPGPPRGASPPASAPDGSRPTAPGMPPVTRAGGATHVASEATEGEGGVHQGGNGLAIADLTGPDHLHHPGQGTVRTR